MNHQLLVVLAPALLAILLLPVAAHAELPGYKQYAVPATVDELKNYIYATIGNVSISGANGVFTISDVKDNKTSVILLNPAFAYRIEGSGTVGLAFSNGTVAANFSLANGPVEIIPHELFSTTNKTASAAAYPAIIIPDGGQATVKIVVELLPSAVSLSAPAPPFQGTTWSGYTDPSQGDADIASRDLGECNGIRVAFWEAHHNSDVDLYIYKDGVRVYSIWSDDAEWHTQSDTDQAEYRLVVHQYGSVTTERQPWMVVYQCGLSQTTTTTPTPAPQPTQDQQTSQPSTDTPAAPFPAMSSETKALAIGAGVFFITILVALAIARR